MGILAGGWLFAQKRTCAGARNLTWCQWQKGLIPPRLLRKLRQSLQAKVWLGLRPFIFPHAEQYVGSTFHADRHAFCGWQPESEA